MLSNKLIDAINDQVNFELYSEYLYLSMAAYFESEDLPGFANFFRVQVQEERFHAMRFFDYMIQMDARVRLKPIDGPKVDFDNALQVFEESLSHEKIVTGRIYSLMNIAQDEKEHATISFLKWFIDEQVEEEDTLKKIISKLKRGELNPAVLYMLDTELAARVFTPPIIN